MSGKGLFKAIGHVFSGREKDAAGREQAESESKSASQLPPEKPADESPAGSAGERACETPPESVGEPVAEAPQSIPQAEGIAAVERQVEVILDAFRRQQEQTIPLLEGLGSLSRQAGQVIHAGKRQTDLAESMRGILAQLSDGNQELAKALQDQAGEARRHTDLLSDIREKLAAEGPSDVELAGALNRVASVMENARKAGDAQVAAVEKIRDEFFGAADSIAAELARQRKATTWLMGGAVAAMLAILAALIVLIHRVFTI